MSRKSKYSAEQKLAILNELTRSNISEVKSIILCKILYNVLPVSH